MYWKLAVRRCGGYFGILELSFVVWWTWAQCCDITFYWSRVHRSTYDSECLVDFCINQFYVAATHPYWRTKIGNGQHHLRGDEGFLLNPKSLLLTSERCSISTSTFKFNTVRLELGPNIHLGFLSCFTSSPLNFNFRLTRRLFDTVFSAFGLSLHEISWKLL